MRKRSKSAWKWVGGALVLALAACAFAFLPLREWAGSFESWIDGLGPAGIGLFAAVYVLATLALVPAWPFTLVAGAIFGVVGGFVLVWASAMAGACLAFVLSRYALRSHVERHVARNSVLRIVDKALRKQGWKVVVLMRMSPLVPFGIQNYFYGVTQVKFGAFALGSALGMIPGEIVYVWLASTGREALSEGGAVRWALLGVGTVATGVAIWLIGRTAKKKLGIRK